MKHPARCLLATTALWAACSSSSDGQLDDTGARRPDGAVDASADAVLAPADAPVALDGSPPGTDANASDGGGAGLDAGTDATVASDAGTTPASFTIKTPTFSAPKGSEDAKCFILDLGNATAVHVGHVRTTLSPPVYEVRISAVTAAPQPEPTTCVAFSDVQDAGSRPLVFARNNIENLTFPTGVGYTLAPHQSLRVEVHTWNPTDDALPVNVSATFDVVPGETFAHEAGLLLLEAADVHIDPHAVADLGPVFFAGSLFPGVSIVGLEGYTHELGVRFGLGLANGPSDPTPTSIYSPDPWNPANPLVVAEPSPVTVPSGGGITLGCGWNNTTNQVATRGPSVGDERCAAFLSYYPALPAHVCLHQGGSAGPTICCPGTAGCP